MKCNNCDFLNLPSHQYCGRCGSLIAQACMDCGKFNPLNYDYCGHCGTSLNIPPGNFEREEPSATYSYFPASKSAYEVKTPTGQGVIDLPITLLRGERRVATVIVADVRKSMDLLARMGSEAWVDVMSKLLQVMSAQIYRFGGKVDQFRGDGLVAFFGARDAHEDDPERAVMAALAMQEVFEHYKKEYSQLKSQDVKLRIGINTDELIVAQVGSKGLHREDTAMGEAIALAARLEAAAEPGTVLISETTYKLITGKFHCIDLGDLDIKGIEMPVKVFRPIALRSDAEILQEMQSYVHLSPLIGRFEEYDLLRQKVDKVIHGSGDIVLINGERGLGKTFLVQQVHQDLVLRKQVYEKYSPGFPDEEQPAKPPSKVLWLRGWANSYEQPSPLFLWRILIKSWLGVDPKDTDEDLLNRLISYCKDLWPDTYTDFLPMLSSVLAISNETLEADLAKLDAQGYQGKLIHTVREWLRTLSSKMPLVLSLGSVQWANTGSVDLLREVISLTEDHSILWFIVYRPERHAPVWHFQQFLETEYPHRLSFISLRPFNEDESKALIEFILQPNELDLETLNIIVERAEGNPFFIRELVNNLVNEKILVKDQETNTWRLIGSITSSDLPESLHSLFLARIDKLTQADRLILQIASVVGFIFWKSVITQLTPEELKITESLNNLQKEGLIEERGSDLGMGIAYHFSSTLIKDVTYESILSSQRKKMHAEIAEFLMNCESNQEISPNLLAHQFKMAGNLKLELFFRIQAASQSKNIFANQEAFQEYSRALEVLDEMEHAQDGAPSYAILTQRFEFVKDRIEILYHLGRVIDANQEAKRLLTIADQIEGEPIWHIDALLAQPGVKFVQNLETLQEGIPQAEEALELSQKIEDPYREMLSLAAVAGHKFLQNDPDWYEFGKRAIAIAEKLDDKKTLVELLLGLAGAYGMDKLDMGLELVKKARPIAEAINYKGAQIEMLYWLGTKFERAGDYYKLLTEYEEKRLSLARELGWRLVEARSLMFVGQIKGLYLGDYEKAIPYLEQGENLWQDTDARLFIYLRLAQVHTNLKSFKKARQYLSLAEPLSSHFVQSLAVVGYKLVSAILYLKIGTLESLMRVLEDTKSVLQIAEEQNLVSRQYRMAAACKSAQAELKIAEIMKKNEDFGGYEHYKKKALDSSGLALDTYNEFGFTQIVEAVSEEILYYHGLALKENEKHDESEVFMHKAYDELMRKFNLIPEETHYRKTFMSMHLHQFILNEEKNSINS